MSDTHEALAAILAEMRDFAKPLRVGGDLCGNVALPATISIWADRIEAAADRMRDAYCELCKEKDAAYDRLLLERDKAIKARAPANAAAMREALEEANTYLGNIIPTRREIELRKHIRAALSAPSRNCDRFATVGAAHKAWRATDQERDFADWLFDKAEGGDHA